MSIAASFIPHSQFNGRVVLLKDAQGLERQLAESDEAYATLTTLLRNRFPKRHDGSLPDFKIEDVLKDNQKLQAWRKCAELNNAAMNGTVKRHRLALAELCGEKPPSFDSPPPNILDNLHSVANAQAEFERLKLAE